MNNIINKFKNIDNNDKIVLKNTFFAFIVKGGALVISLLSTPAFINYFENNVVLGVWYTMLSVLVWFLNFDLGIGNGIRNHLTVAFAKNDRNEAKYILSSGIFSTLIVTLILSVIGILVLFLSDLNALFNVSESVLSKDVLFISALFVFISIMLRFMLTTISAVFYALQKSAINNLIALFVSILQLIFVLFFKFETISDSLIYLSLAYLVCSNLPLICAGIFIFHTKLRDCTPSIKFVKKIYIRKVLSIGGIFFICQILYMLITNTNEFLITNLFGPNYTTEYTFYYKITSLISMIITLAMTPIWSVVTKAMTEKKWEWLNNLYSKIKKVGFLIIIFEFVLIPFLQPLMNIWLGNNTIEVNYIYALAFACFGSVFVYSGMLSTIVCGLARMKLQTICYTLGVIFKFLFVLIFSNYTNEWIIVVWSNAIILLPYCAVQQISLNKYFNKKIKIEKGRS